MEIYIILRIPIRQVSGDFFPDPRTIEENVKGCPLWSTAPIIHDLLFIEVNLLTQSRPGLHPANPPGLTAQWSQSVSASPSLPTPVRTSGALNSSLTIYQRTWFNDILYFISFLSSSFPHLPVEDKLGGKTENSLTLGQKVSCPRLDKLSNPNQSSGRWRPITLILFLDEMFNTIVLQEIHFRIIW